MNGSFASPHAARQARIIVGNSVRYWAARAALLSPWYQMTPAIGSPATGATSAFHSTEGLVGSSVPSSFGREFQSATAGFSLRSTLYDHVPARPTGSSSASPPTRRTVICAGAPANPPPP